jgi:hypothetical protein
LRESSSRADRDVEAAKSEDADVEKDGEEDTYLHGIQLALVFVALASSMFLIVLDQTVSRAGVPGLYAAHAQILIPAIPVIASHFNAVKQIGWISS